MVAKSLLIFKHHHKSYSPKPSLLAGVYYFLFIFIICSCTTIKLPSIKKTQTIYKGGHVAMSSEDYAEQLASLKSAFLTTPGLKFIEKDFIQKYLTELSGEIISKNEIFFKNLKKASVNIIKNEAPIHFSLPKGAIFISSGLITKYIKHESVLVCILAYELVRSENLLYPKQVIVPVGYMNLERMLALSRLNVDEKMEIHKWAYYLTVRSGFDGEYYLSWLQTQNRNTADFIQQVGDINLINQEESLFKAFLIKNSNEDETPIKKNSSKTFYTFLNSIRDQQL